jgi:hypothetical protein
MASRLPVELDGGCQGAEPIKDGDNHGLSTCCGSGAHIWGSFWLKQPSKGLANDKRRTSEGLAKDNFSENRRFGAF